MGNAGSAEFPYTMAEGSEVSAYSAFRTPWQMHQGTHSSTGSPVTIFTFTKVNAVHSLDPPRNYMAKLRVLKHPSILKYLDAVETDAKIHIVTEPVTPLILPLTVPDDDVAPQVSKDANKGAVAAAQMAAPSKQEAAQLLLSLGLSQIVTGLQFLNEKANIAHCNVHPSSIFIAANGDWKLGGFDLAFKTTPSTAAPVIAGMPNAPPIVGSIPSETRNSSSLQPDLYACPEWVGQKWRELEQAPLWSIDSWSMGCLLYHCFNGPIKRASDLSNVQNIPATLQADYRKLLSTVISHRPSPSQLLASPFFANHLISTVQFIDAINIKSNDEKKQFFQNFSTISLTLPRSIVKSRILPQMLTVLEFGGTTNSPFPAILHSVIRLGASCLSSTEFSRVIIPTIVKLFSSTERAVRVLLLQQLPHYIEYLVPTVITNDVFPQVLTGYRDAHPTLRELTVQATPLFAPHIPVDDLESKVLPQLAALQADQQPEVRVHVTYCLAKIAKHLSKATQDKILLPALSRGLKDSFPPARVASLDSLTVTLDLHSADSCARRVLPYISPYTVDPHAGVRVSALRLMNAIMPKLVKRNQEMKEAETAAANAAGNLKAMGSTTAAGSAATASSSSSSSSASSLLPSSGAADSAASRAAGFLGSMGSWAASAVHSAVKSTLTSSSSSSSSASPSGAGAATTAGSSSHPSYASIGTSIPSSQAKPALLSSSTPTTASSTTRPGSSSTTTSSSSVASPDLLSSFGTIGAIGSTSKTAAAAKKNPLNVISVDDGTSFASSSSSSSSDAFDNLFGDMGGGGGGGGKMSGLNSPHGIMSSAGSDNAWGDWGDPLGSSSSSSSSPSSSSSSSRGGGGASHATPEDDDWGSMFSTSSASSTKTTLSASKPSTTSSSSLNSAANAVDWTSLTVKPKASASTSTASSTTPSSSIGGAASGLSSISGVKKATPSITSLPMTTSTTTSSVASGDGGAKKKDDLDDWASFINS